MITDYMQLLQKALAEEIEAQRLYVAMLVLAPEEDRAQLLELFKDESDHSAILEDMVIKYTTSQPGTVAERIGGVE